jgi:hypothetical protein
MLFVMVAVELVGFVDVNFAGDDKRNTAFFGWWCS